MGWVIRRGAKVPSAELYVVANCKETQIGLMRAKHGIYFAGSGRINIAGLTVANIDQFIAAVADVTG